MRDKNIHSSVGTCFHLVNHSVDGRELFYHPGDYKTYLLYLREYLDSGISIISYCLMPNHFHFLLQQNAPEAISFLFERVHKRYARYYNKKTGFKGKIFRNSLQYQETLSEQYLLNASAYIHANPLQANLVVFPEDWEFSNMREYLSLRKSSNYSEQFLRDYIGDAQEYRQLVINLAHRKSMQQAFLKDQLN